MKHDLAEAKVVRLLSTRAGSESTGHALLDKVSMMLLVLLLLLLDLLLAVVLPVLLLCAAPGIWLTGHVLLDKVLGKGDSAVSMYEGSENAANARDEAEWKQTQNRGREHIRKQKAKNRRELRAAREQAAALSAAQEIHDQRREQERQVCAGCAAAPVLPCRCLC